MTENQINTATAREIIGRNNLHDTPLFIKSVCTVAYSNECGYITIVAAKTTKTEQHAYLIVLIDTRNQIMYINNDLFDCFCTDVNSILTEKHILFGDYILLDIEDCEL